MRDLKIGGDALREPGSHLPGGRIFFPIRDEREGPFFDQGEKMLRSKGKPKNHNTIEFELGHANILDLMSLASVMNSGSNTL